MNFLNLYGLIALVAVPLVVLLYFLKLRRPHVVVPSALLWKKVLEDMRVNAPFQRLRRSLLMILQILAVAAIAFALARPMMKAQDPVQTSYVVLVDASASMNTREDGRKTRLDLAKASVDRLIEGMGPNDEMMLIRFHASAEMVCGFSGERRRLKDALASIKATDCPTKPDPALLLAKSVCTTRQRPKVIMVSDGAFSETATTDMPVPVECEAIGTARPNVAVTALDVRRPLNDRSRVEMFVSIENFGSEAFSGNLKMMLGKEMLDSKFVGVGAKEVLSQVFEARLEGGGDVGVEIDARDSLECDNVAWKVVQPPFRHRVVVVGPGTFFIEKALRAFKDVESTAVDRYVPEVGSNSTLVIWNCVEKPGVAPCHNLYFGCAPEGVGITVSGVVSNPAALDWNTTHPINRFLDFDNLLISSAISLKLPEHAVTVMRSAQTPVVATMGTQDGSLTLVGFDPVKSNWPLLVSFPLFLRNVLGYVEDTEAHRIERNVPVGRPIVMRTQGRAPLLVLPSGETMQLEKDAGGSWSSRNVEKCGIYRVEFPDGGGSVSMAANLFDRTESALEPAATPTIAGKAAVSAALDRRVNREYWRWLVLALVVILGGEWILYHRRMFV